MIDSYVRGITKCIAPAKMNVGPNALRIRAVYGFAARLPLLEQRRQVLAQLLGADAWDLEARAALVTADHQMRVGLAPAPEPPADVRRVERHDLVPRQPAEDRLI